MESQPQGNLESEMDRAEVGKNRSRRINMKPIYCNGHRHEENEAEQEKNYANAFWAAAQNARGLQEMEWLQFQLKESTPHQQLQLSLQSAFGCEAIVEANPQAGSEGMVTSSSASCADKHPRKKGRKRGMEKITERRHKRMIRNRESAARSRARRQAYTKELEIEVTHLTEENAKLKMQLVSEILIPASDSQQMKNILRRTSTAPF